jgi:hypothetical protein
MCTQLQSTVLSIWIVPQLAALISSLDFDKTSGCTERESNIVLLCNEKRKLDSFAVAYQQQANQAELSNSHITAGDLQVIVLR